MPKTTTLPTGDTTLAELLAAGATVTFGSGRRMTGQTRDRYIAVANEFGPLGLWDMDSKDGVRDAVGDLARDAAESSMDLHGAPLPQDGDENRG